MNKCLRRIESLIEGQGKAAHPSVRRPQSCRAQQFFKGLLLLLHVLILVLPFFPLLPLLGLLHVQNEPSADKLAGQIYHTVWHTDISYSMTYMFEMRNVCWCIMYMPYRYIGHPYSLPSCSFSTSSPLPSSSSSSTSSSSWSSISLHQPDCTKPSEPQVWTLVCQVLKIKPNSIFLDCNFKISIKLELQGALGIPTSSLLDIAFVPSALRMSDPCKA